MSQDSSTSEEGEVAVAQVVWIRMAAPDAWTDGNEETVAELSSVVGDALARGWGVPGPDSDVHLAGNGGADGAPDVLDVDLVVYPGGLRIGLVVDTERVAVACAVAAGLAEHLQGSAPVLLGWTVRALLAEPRPGPSESGEWFNDALPPGPHFPAAAHLSDSFQELGAQYLIAGAVRYLHDPVAGSGDVIDAADLVAGASEDPWVRELPAALGGLLVAAARLAQDRGQTAPVVGRGEGDPAVAARLMVYLRGDLDDPSTGYTDDRMRGHVLLDQFAHENHLVWNTVDPALDHDEDDKRSRERLRILLWAGLRALAALTSGNVDTATARTPWTWLAALNCDAVDDVVTTFAHRDEARLAVYAAEDDTEADKAADAHLLMQIALLHAELLHDPEHRRLRLVTREATTDPLVHLLADTLGNLGADALDIAAARCPAGEPAETARVFAGILHRLEAHDLDAAEELLVTVEELLNTEQDQHASAFLVLTVIGAAAEVAGAKRAAQIAGYLLRHPTELACVVTERSDSDRDIRRRTVAKACMVTPRLAAGVALRFPEVGSADPRDEPGLRVEVMTWWQQLTAAARADAATRAAATCPEPGATALRSVAHPDGPGFPSPGISTPDLLAAVVQAVSALALTTGNHDLPSQVVRSESPRP